MIQIIDGVTYELAYDYEPMRVGFRHIAHLKRDGFKVCTGIAKWGNRTWEGYFGQCAMKAAVRIAMDKRAAYVKSGYKSMRCLSRISKTTQRRILNADAEYVRLERLMESL